LSSLHAKEGPVEGNKKTVIEKKKKAKPEEQDETIVSCPLKKGGTQKVGAETRKGELPGN